MPFLRNYINYNGLLETNGPNCVFLIGAEMWKYKKGKFSAHKQTYAIKVLWGEIERP